MELRAVVHSSQVLAELGENHHIGDIREALTRVHCYRVIVSNEDFGNILINSSNEQRELSQAEYPSLQEVIMQISKDSTFFDRTRWNGGLSGTRVKQLYDEFVENGSKPQYFFLVDRNYFPAMNNKANYYVRDGMHHLVAYG